MQPVPARLIAQEISKIDIRLNPQEYSRRVMRVICEKLGYHFGSVLHVTPEGDGEIFSAYNLPETYPELIARVAVSLLSSPSGQAIKEGKTIVVTDVFSEPRLIPWYGVLEQFKIKTMAWIPLFSRGKAFGTYILYDQRQRVVTDDEIDVLNQLSMLFSMAIRSSEHIFEINQKSLALEAEINERKVIEKKLLVARDQAEAANRAKNEFLATMTHEIRTPMNAILGFTTLLLEDENEPERQDTLHIIHEAGENLLHLIDDILDFSKIEAGQLELSSQPFSLKELMEEIYHGQSLSKQRPEGPEFHLSVEPVVPEIVDGDRYRVNQVLLCIIKNAFKFTTQGRISIRCTYDNPGETAIFEIEDTGIGIPENKQDMIFQAFTQADSSNTREHGGTGLGLAIASRLAQLMSGRLTVESEVGIGSTFRLELPLPTIN